MQLTSERPVVDRDTDLLEALRRRDATAAEQLVARYGGRAYRLAAGITGNEQDAEEAVQNAFWSVIHKIDTYRGAAALGSWIYRITANAAYQRRRSARRRRDEISLDDPTVQIELRSVLTSALEDLPDHYCAVIVLHDVEGLSMAEVADSLDITVPTAKARAHRARLRLRPRLAEFMSDATCGVEMVA